MSPCLALCVTFLCWKDGKKLPGLLIETDKHLYADTATDGYDLMLYFGDSCHPVTSCLQGLNLTVTQMFVNVLGFGFTAS